MSFLPWPGMGEYNTFGELAQLTLRNLSVPGHLIGRDNG